MKYTGWCEDDFNAQGASGPSSVDSDTARSAASTRCGSIATPPARAGAAAPYTISSA